MLGHGLAHRRRAVALGGMVAAGQKGHTGFARQMRLRLGDLAGDEGIRPGSDGRFEIPLRTPRAPGHPPQRSAVPGHHRGAAFQDLLRLTGPGVSLSGAKLNFGDAEYVYLHEVADDILRNANYLWPDKTQEMLWQMQRDSLEAMNAIREGMVKP